MRLFILSACLIFAFPAFSHDIESEAPPPEVETELAVSLDQLPPGALESVVDQFRLWDAGQTLEFCFLDGSAEQKKFFVATAKTWDDLVSLGFDFGAAPTYRSCAAATPSHIRVTFGLGSSWSSVGTDALQVAQSKPTLSIRSKNFALDNKRSLAGTILHELGHAIAMKHEHQSPDSNCEAEIDWDRAYSILGSPPNSWTKNQVDTYMRPLTQTAGLAMTAYDPKSIMHYALPVEIFRNGENSTCYVKQNTKLSAADKTLVVKMYPTTPQEQDIYLAELDAAAGKLFHDAGVDDETVKKLSALMEDAASRITDRGFASQVVSIVTELNSTTGDCSPVVTGDGSSFVIKC